MKTVSEYIAFFEAIPEAKWCMGAFNGPDDQHCALGHLGWDLDAGRAMASLIAVNFGVSVVSINDCAFGCPSQFKNLPTPKQRILAALREIEGKR